MLRSYSDIRKLIDADPRWWDENGVPRYCEFSPKYLDIYATQAALLLIACQNCGRAFHVAMSSGRPFNRFGESTVEDSINGGWIHYGDPPNIGCCPAGPTMNCLDLGVVEFWRKRGCDWVRHPEFEIKLPDAEESANGR